MNKRLLVLPLLFLPLGAPAFSSGSRSSAMSSQGSSARSSGSSAPPTQPGGNSSAPPTATATPTTTRTPTFAQRAMTPAVTEPFMRPHRRDTTEQGK